MPSLVPPGAILGQFGGWLTLAALVLGPGVAAAVLWAPFLAAARFRALFRRLPPDGRLLASYLLVTVVGSLPYVLGTGQAMVATTGASGAAMANALLDVIVPTSLAYVVGFPLVTAAALPRAGIDWDPTGYGAGTWALLAVAGAWYAATFAVPLLLVSLVLALPM